MKGKLQRQTEGEGEAEGERERQKLVLGDQCMFYCLFCFFVDKDEGRGEEASDAYEQCLGPLYQTPEHKSLYCNEYVG